MLLEVLIAVMVFSIGILGIVGLQAASIRHVNDAQYRGEAIFLANALVSQMWADDRTAADPSYLDATYGDSGSGAHARTTGTTRHAGNARTAAPPARSNRRVIRRRISTTNVMLAILAVGLAIVLYVNNIITVNRLARDVNELQQSYDRLRSSNAALQAEVKTLFLFHHDPNHDDAKVSQMLAHARQLVAARKGALQVEAAREGMMVELPAAVRA